MVYAGRGTGVRGPCPSVQTQWRINALIARSTTNSEKTLFHCFSIAKIVTTLRQKRQVPPLYLQNTYILRQITYLPH